MLKNKLSNSDKPSRWQDPVLRQGGEWNLGAGERCDLLSTGVPGPPDLAWRPGQWHQPHVRQWLPGAAATTPRQWPLPLHHLLGPWRLSPLPFPYPLECCSPQALSWWESVVLTVHFLCLMYLANGESLHQVPQSLPRWESIVVIAVHLCVMYLASRESLYQVHNHFPGGLLSLLSTSTVSILVPTWFWIIMVSASTCIQPILSWVRDSPWSQCKWSCYLFPFHWVNLRIMAEDC